MRTTTRQEHHNHSLEGAFPMWKEEDSVTSHQPAFENPFALDDLLALDEETLGLLLCAFCQEHGAEALASGLAGAPADVTSYAQRALAPLWRERLAQAQCSRGTGHLASDEAYQDEAHQKVLDACFWELTYWKTPRLYAALTEGERIHPGVFRRLAPWLRGATVLDAGAGAGRATFACLAAGARQVYAVEPSPGLRRILRSKIAQAVTIMQVAGGAPSPSRTVPITPMRGRFDDLPLPDHSIDLSLSCSAFTAESAHGGEGGLAELLRVTRPGGHIALIWPRPADYSWLAAHSFTYASAPIRRAMAIHFRSRELALACAHRFYARNLAVISYLESHHTRDLPFSVLGVNPPNDYCWRVA